MSARPLVVFVVSRFTSHLFGVMGLARRLDERGFRIEFWGHDVARERVVEQGFAFRELKGMWHFFEAFLISWRLRHMARPGGLLDVLWTRRNRHRAVRGAVRGFDASLTELCAREVPTLAFFHPFVLHYYPFFKRLGTKCIALCDKPLVEPDPLVPPSCSSCVPADDASGRLRVAWTWYLASARTRLAALRDRIFSALGIYMVGELLGEIGKLTGTDLAAARVQRHVAYDLRFRDVDEWVLADPAADFRREKDLPPGVRYVGACVDTDRREPPCPIVRDDRASHLIFVSMGTAMRQWDADLALLLRVVGACCALPSAQVVVSTGHAAASEALRKSGTSAQVFDFLPQIEVLRMADIAVTHAGANTLRECIATGTPMLAFPRGYDQLGNGARIAYLGIGLRGERHKDGADAIREKVARILASERIRLRVSALRRTAAASEASLLADALETIAPWIGRDAESSVASKAKVAAATT